MNSARGTRRAAGRITVGTLALVGAIALAAALPAPAASAPTDARDELLARLERGARTTWAMTTRFHRDTPAGPLDAQLERLNRRPDWLASGFGSVRGVWKGRTVDCANAPGGKLCGPGRAVEPAVGAQAPVAALRKATSPRGPNAVRRGATIRVVGLRANCYWLVPRRRAGSRRTEYCLNRDGIPLRVRVQRTDSSDTTTAETVRTTVTDADFVRLLRGYPMGSRS